jgi:hypothetical protein
MVNKYFTNSKQQQQENRHIVVSKENFENLKDYAKPGNSWNDVITTILKRLQQKSAVKGGEKRIA